MTRAIVFSGPSLPPSHLAADARLEWRPPVRRGDVHRAAIARPRAIGIVDGYFESTPTVWHEEILFAISAGVPVYGAASIGALRAAELDRFGVRGVGLIYDWFRDGVLEDDDEVAVVHGPLELGFPPLSEAMVNIRATVANAVGRTILDRHDGETIVETAKTLFFKARTWENIRERLPTPGLRHVAQRLSQHPTDQKRQDAAAMIRAMLTETFTDEPSAQN